MTAERPTIERLPDEHPARFQARVEYIVAGPERSLESVSQKLGKSRVLLERWSSADGWVDHARRWDSLIVNLRTQAEVDAYRAELEDHRRRYGDMGKALYQVAAKLLKQLDGIAGQAPKTIEGKDGKWYKIPGIEITPATLTVASRAVTIAADLEAHALRLADILPKLDHDVQD
jgi:hypothetical protein